MAQAKKRGISKSKKVANHLLKHGSITSWEAIKLYKATRLSAIIFNLRKRKWDIITEEVSKKDENGYPCTFAKYILLEKPKVVSSVGNK